MSFEQTARREHVEREKDQVIKPSENKQKDQDNDTGAVNVYLEEKTSTLFAFNCVGEMIGQV